MLPFKVTTLLRIPFSLACGAGSETVKAPGNLVVSAYVTCPDITQVVTPDIKAPGASKLLHVDLGAGRRRLGGSALAQAYMQVGWAVEYDKPVVKNLVGAAKLRPCLVVFGWGSSRQEKGLCSNGVNALVARWRVYGLA